MASNWKLLNRVWHANLGMAAGVSLGIIALSCPFIAHKWEAGKFLMQIHYGEFLPKETRWIWIDSQGLLLAFLIGSGWLMHRKAVKKAASVAADDPAVAGSSVTVLGLGDLALAKSLTTQAETRGLRAFGCDAEGFTALDLSLERWLIVTSAANADAESIRRVLAHLGTAKAGALKRLEFAISPGLDEESSKTMEKLLRTAGAKPMRIPAGEGEWAARVTGHLCAQSVSLASRQKAAPAQKRTPVATAPSLAAGGFTIVEILCVLVILSLLIGGVAAAMNSLGRRDTVHSAVHEFAALVREARQTARREGAMVRLAMLTPEIAQRAGLEEFNQRTSWGLYVFRNPAARLPTAVIAPPSSAMEPDRKLSEVAPLSRVPLIEELIGGWEAAPGHDVWRKWSDVSVTGALFDSFSSGSNTVAATYRWQPESHWSLAANGSTTTPYSIYPPNFASTPFPPQRKTVTQTLADASSVTLNGVGEWKATDVWGTAPVLRWPTSRSSSATSYAMPALDFLADGSLACAGTSEQVEFQFSAPDGKPPVYHVVVDAREGTVWIR